MSLAVSHSHSLQSQKNLIFFFVLRRFFTAYRVVGYERMVCQLLSGRTMESNTGIRPPESAFERRLIARLQSGDADAMNVLFEANVDRAFAFAFRLLNDREDAEEVVSEAFLKAFEKAATFRGECPFRGWLFGIVRNLSMDRLRQPKLLILEPAEMASIEQPVSSPATIETRALIESAMGSLEEPQRMALILCDVEQWDHAEAAEIMGRSVAATKSLLYRARRALRDRLAEAWDEA